MINVIYLAVPVDELGKTIFFPPAFHTKTFLPRQARDKHVLGNSKKTRSLAGTRWHPQGWAPMVVATPVAAMLMLPAFTEVYRRSDADEKEQQRRQGRYGHRARSSTNTLEVDL